MKIKKGDTVLVITGKYKNETANIKNKGEVLRVLPKDNKIVVKGLQGTGRLPQVRQGRPRCVQG